MSHSLRQWNNEDGSVYVAEMSISGALLHIHEEVDRINGFSPETLIGTSIAIGLFVEDPQTVMAKAVAAGLDYDYRQGCLSDSFGHHWLMEKKIG